MNKISISEITMKQAVKLDEMAHALGIVSNLDIEAENLNLGMLFHRFKSVEKANFSNADVLVIAQDLIQGNYQLKEMVENSEFGRAAYSLLQYRCFCKDTVRLNRARHELEMSKSLRHKEDRDERRLSLSRIIDSELRHSRHESRAEIFRIWLKAILPEAKFNLVYSDLWDDSDDLRFKVKERSGVRPSKKIDTELSQFEKRLETALGLKCKVENGQEKVIHLFPEGAGSIHKETHVEKIREGRKIVARINVTSFHPDGLCKAVKDYCLTKTKFTGPRPLGMYPGIARDVLLSSLRGDAMKLLEFRFNQFGDSESETGGLTIFEGGVDSEPGKLALDLLWQRLKMATPDEDAHHIYQAWSFVVVQQDFTSNERSAGTIRAARRSK